MGSSLIWSELFTVKSNQYVMVEKLLESLVGVVDTQLLKTVELWK